MTLQRLLLLATLCMLLTGAAVYVLTPARRSQDAVAQEPLRPAATPRGDAGAPATTSSGSVTSPVPTAKEWLTAPEVEVEGAKRLRCNARKLREWLRVICERGAESGSVPLDVRVLDARALKTEVGAKGIVHTAWRVPLGSVYTAAGSDLISLVCPFVEGLDLKVRFEWSDKSAVLAVRWPAGGTEPGLKGSFTQGERGGPR